MNNSSKSCFKLQKLNLNQNKLKRVFLAMLNGLIALFLELNLFRCVSLNKKNFKEFNNNIWVLSKFESLKAFLLIFQTI